MTNNLPAVALANLCERVKKTPVAQVAKLSYGDVELFCHWNPSRFSDALLVSLQRVQGLQQSSHR